MDFSPSGKEKSYITHTFTFSLPSFFLTRFKLWELCHKLQHYNIWCGALKAINFRGNFLASVKGALIIDQARLILDISKISIYIYNSLIVLLKHHKIMEMKLFFVEIPGYSSDFEEF